MAQLLAVNVGVPREITRLSSDMLFCAADLDPGHVSCGRLPQLLIDKLRCYRSRPKRYNVKWTSESECFGSPEAAMSHSSASRDRFLSESAFARSPDNRKEQVQRFLAFADVRIDGDREWDITVNNDQFYPRVLRHGSLGLGESYVGI